MSRAIRIIALFQLALVLMWFLEAWRAGDLAGWQTHFCLAAWCLTCFIGYGKELP